MSRLLVLVLLLLPLAESPAQTEPSSPGRQRAAERRARREARQTNTPYQDSHLAGPRQPRKRGESAPIAPVAGEPRFDRDGLPHVTEPKYPGLRLRKPKAISPR